MSKKAARREFTVNGETYAIVQPSIEVINEADKIRGEVYNKELQSGTLLREQLETELKKRDLWNNEIEQEFKLLRAEISSLEYTLSKGGIKLSDAKQIAIQIKNKRERMISIISSRTELDSKTCQGKSEAARFNHLLIKCLVYSNGEPYFKNGMADYLMNPDDPVANTGASELFYMLSDTEHSNDRLIENKFLRRFKFANEKNQLIDEDGRLVDSEGKHVDENYNYIKWTSDTEFIYVDSEGRPIDEEGNFAVEEEAFLDDDGNPIVLEESEDQKDAEDKVEEKVENKPTKTRKRKSTAKTK